jgi:DNA-binding transcriptional regulator YdaS (Cro superfamily)
MKKHWTSLFDRKGFQTALAKRFGKHKATINEWRKTGIPVPYCAGVEEECDGEFTRRDFRPDDWQEIWPELAEKLVA